MRNADVLTEGGSHLTVLSLHEGSIAIMGKGLFRFRPRRERGPGDERDYEASFRLLFDSNPLPMWVFERATLACVAVNDSAVAHLGYPRSQLSAMRVTDLSPAEEEPVLARHLRGEAHAEQPSIWHQVTKDGRVREVELSWNALELEGREAVLMVSIDVTERNETQRQRESLETRLRQAMKMEAVGRLAGGIAHDFNNILAVVTNYAAFLIEDLGPHHPRLDDVEQIKRAGERGARLVRQLSAFSRREAIAPRVVALNDIVSEMDKMLRRTIGEDVKMAISLREDTWKVNVDPGQLEQVLLNLAVNARDAMREGGDLILETYNVEIDADMAALQVGMKSGPHAVLSVSDSGVGMSEDVRAHVFEPFFTTKARSEGTGLGLATVYGIVKQAGGYIAVYSQPGWGTTFRIYLPAAEVQSVDDRPARAKVVRRGAGECICVVEDEEPVRELVTRVLGRAGYKVVPAASGLEALESIAQSEGIDVLLTDVIMPGISGRELADRVARDIGPTPTIFMSGYTDAIVARRGVLEEGEALLQKPFTAEDLLAKLEEVLSA